jgi:hypothetical protein
MSAEQIFITTHQRYATGKYVVRLSLNVTPFDTTTETRRMALGSLQHIHGRFNCDPLFANDYSELMETYERLGHMDGIPSKHLSALKAWYLPHHALMSTTANKKKFGLFSMLRGKHGIVITRGIL